MRLEHRPDIHETAYDLVFEDDVRVQLTRTGPEDWQFWSVEFDAGLGGKYSLGLGHPINSGALVRALEEKATAPDGA